MNKSELVDAIADRSGVSKRDVDDAEGHVRGRRETVSKGGDKITIPGSSRSSRATVLLDGTEPRDRGDHPDRRDQHRQGVGWLQAEGDRRRQGARPELSRRLGPRVRPVDRPRRRHPRAGPGGRRFWTVPSMAVSPPGDQGPGVQPLRPAREHRPAVVLQGPQGARVLLSEGRHARLHDPGVRAARHRSATSATPWCSASAPTSRPSGKFDEKYGLGFPLLSDADHAVAEAYGVVGREDHVRQEVHGDHPLGVPRRREGQDRPRPGRRSARRTPRPTC